MAKSLGGRTETDSFSVPVPHGASIFLAPKSFGSFQPGLAWLSSSRVWRLAPGGEPDLLPGLGVPGTSTSSAGLRGTPGGPVVLCRGCRCRACLVAVG